MKTHRIRRGFTLVEIMIVLGIIAALAAVLVPVSLRLTDRNQVPRGAEMLATMAEQAKSRAAYNKRPAGIRLIRTDNSRRSLVTVPNGNAGFAWYTEIVPIEDPGDYNEGWVWGISTGTPRQFILPFWPASTLVGTPSSRQVLINMPAGNWNFNAFVGVQQTGPTGAATTVPFNNFPKNRVLFGPTRTDNWQGAPMDPFSGIPGTRIGFVAQSPAFSFHSANTTRHAFVEAGDRIVVDGVGVPYRVEGVDPDFTIDDNGTGSPNDDVRCSAILLDRPLPVDISPPINRRPNYRVIRQPRVAAGQAPTKLPQDVVIDLTPGLLAGNRQTNGTWMSNVSTGLGISACSGVSVAGTGSEAPPFVDILFSPSGEILPTTQNFRRTNPTPTTLSSFSVGSSNILALWIHPWAEPTSWSTLSTTAAQGSSDNQNVVVINARSGAIGSFPVDARPASTNPLTYAVTGTGRIDGDTGQ